jgi:hypothetical protein
MDAKYNSSISSLTESQFDFILSDLTRLCEEMSEGQIGDLADALHDLRRERRVCAKSH